MKEQMFNVQFVREVEKHPVLYNYMLPGYSMKDLTERAWCEVGKQVQMTADECKVKWKNLRAVFVRNMKPAQSESMQKKRKAYYLADAMQFALPFVKVLTHPITMPESVPEASQPEQDAFNASENEDSSSQVPASFPLPSPASPELSDSRPKSRTIPSRKRTPKNDEEERLLMQYLEAKRTKVAGIQEDGFCQSDKLVAAKHFVLSLLPELDEMTDDQIKVFKRRTLQLIDEIINQDSFCYRLNDVLYA